MQWHAKPGEEPKKLLPIKTYRVTVGDYEPILFSARSPSKARYLAFCVYQSAYDRTTFRQFIGLGVSVTRTMAPDGIGKRVVICDRLATAVIPSCGWSTAGHSDLEPAYMRDDNDVIFRAHPLEVRPL